MTSDPERSEVMPFGDEALPDRAAARKMCGETEEIFTVLMDGKVYNPELAGDGGGKHGIGGLSRVGTSRDVGFGDRRSGVGCLCRARDGRKKYDAANSRSRFGRGEHPTIREHRATIEILRRAEFGGEGGGFVEDVGYEVVEVGRGSDVGGIHGEGMVEPDSGDFEGRDVSGRRVGAVARGRDERKK
jgi:hypothetical protein